jgi:hypothetical protein
MTAGTIANTDWGTTFETAVCTRHDLDDVANENGEYRHVDAVEADGTAWAIKVARVRISDGDSERRGRYWVPAAEVERCDRYAFGVYDDGGVREGVITTLSADAVRERLPAFVESPRSDVELVARPAWSRFISPPGSE